MLGSMLSLRAQWSIALLSFGFGASALVLACKSDAADTTKPVDPNATPEQIFRALQDDLIGTCGGVNGVCHVKGEYKNPQGEAAKLWLGPGDPYTTAKMYPGIIPITGDTNDSKLLTQIDHDGPSLGSKPELRTNVATWVAAEIKAKGVAHSTDAFYVREGANTVALGSLAAGAEGATLTFNAQTLGGNEYLTEMKITGVASKTLIVSNVTLVILPASGPTRLDTVGGFNGTLTVRPGKTVPFFSGDTILTGWNSQNRLKLVFSSFIASDPAMDAGLTVACKSVTTFVSSAVPAFLTDEGNGQTCMTCHADKNAMPGSSHDVAINTWDLRNYDTDPAGACARSLALVNAMDKTKSNIIATPTGGTGGDPTHPVRYVCGMTPPPPDGGTTAACVPTTYSAALLGWLNNE